MKDPGMAVLVNLAQRCRRAKKYKRRLVEKALHFDLTLKGFSEEYVRATAAENEAWNALQASKEVYTRHKETN